MPRPPGFALVKRVVFCRKRTMLAVYLFGYVFYNVVANTINSKRGFVLFCPVCSHICYLVIRDIIMPPLMLLASVWI